MENPFTYIKDGEILKGEDGIIAKVKTKASDVVNKLKKSLNIDKSKTIEEVPDELITNIVSAFKDGALKFKPGLETKRDNSSFKTTSNQSTDINHSTEGNKNVTVKNSTKDGSATWKDGGHTAFTLGGDNIVDGGAGAYLDASYKISTTRTEKESDPNSNGFNYEGVDVNKSAQGHVKTGGHIEVCGRRADIPIDLHGEANCGYSHWKENGTIHHQSIEGNKLINTTESKNKRSVGAKAAASGGLSVMDNSINAGVGAYLDAGYNISSKRTKKESDPNSDGFNYEGVDVNKSAQGHVKTGGHIEVCGRRADIPIDLHGEANCGYSHWKEYGTIHHQSIEGNKLINTTETKNERSVGARAGASGGLSVMDNSINADARANVEAGYLVSSEHIDYESLPNIDGYECEGTKTTYSAAAHMDSEANLNASANILGKTAGVNATGSLKAEGRVSCSHLNFKEKSSTRDETREQRVFHKVTADASGQFEANVNANAHIGGKSKDFAASVKGNARGHAELTAAEWSYTKNKDGFTGHFEALSAEAEGEVNLEASVGSKSVKMSADGRVAAQAVNADADLTIKKDEQKTAIGGVHANIGHLSARGRAGVQFPGRDKKHVEAEAEFNLASVNALQAEVREKEECDEADIHVKAGLANANIANAKIVGEKTGKKATVTMDTTLADLNAGNVSITGIDNRESNRTGVNARVKKTASANIGNVEITGLGSRETRFDVDTGPGVDAFNIRCGIHRNTGGSVSTNRVSYGNIDLTIGPPNWNLSFGNSVGNIGIPFFGGGGSGGGGGSSNQGKSNQPGEEDEEAGTSGNQQNGGGGTGGDGNGTGGKSTGGGGNCTSGNNTGGNSTGGGGNGTSGNNTGGNRTGGGGNGTSGNNTDGNSTGGGGNGTSGNNTGGNSTGGGGNGTGISGSATGTSGNGTRGGGDGTGRGGNGTRGGGTGGFGNGTHGNGTGCGGNGTNQNGTGSGGNGSGRGGNGTGGDGNGTHGHVTSGGGNGTNRNGTGGGGNGTGAGGNGTNRNGSGAGGNGTGRGGNGTGTGGNGTRGGGNGTGRNATRGGGNGTGGNATRGGGNGTSGNGTHGGENGTGGVNGTGTGGSGSGGKGFQGTGGSGRTLRSGKNGTGRGGNGTGRGANGTGGNGTGTGNGRNGTGNGRNGTGIGGNNNGIGDNGSSRNLKDTADQNRMLAELVGKHFTKPNGNTQRSSSNQTTGATPFDWSNTEKVEELVCKAYNPNYTPENKQSGFSQSGSRETRKSKPQQKQERQKPSGSNKNIHTIFTIGAGDSKPIQKLGNNVYGFGNDE